MKAFVEAYEDRKQIVKICSEDDKVVEVFEVTGVILENHIPMAFKAFPDVRINMEITRN